VQFFNLKIMKIYFSIGFNMPYVYLAAQAQTLGITPESASLLISTIGGANTIGRIMLGYISDKPWINRLHVYNICLTICGIATALSAFCVGFWGLAIYATVFGFTIGAYVGLTSVILVDLLGLENLTNAFGLLLLFQGIASFVGPPIGGWLYDKTLYYEPAFVLAGVSIAISGLMLYFIPPLQRHLERKEANAASMRVL
jgi:MFS transporter, MCT family, solute carrier family 16 (monocarboxylic acid transporters), member 14